MKNYPESKVEVKGLTAKFYDLFLNVFTLGYYYFFIKRVIKTMNIKGQDLILDMGTGTGRNVCLMKKYLSEKGKIKGIDISENMISQFLKKCRKFSNISMVLSNLLWAHLSDFHGNKKVIQLASFFGVIIPFLAIITKPSSSLIFVILFITIGIFTAGSNIGKTNFLLDISKPKERPIYVGMNNTLTFPITLFPFLGGILIHIISYKFLFYLTFLIMISGFLLSLHLKEPREEKEERNLTF